MRLQRPLITLAAAVYLGAVVGLAFVPGSAANRQFWLWPFAAFLPVGILLTIVLGRRRWWAALGFSVLGSAWLEAAQSIWMPVGYAEPVDVAWSTLGAATGVFVALLVTTGALPQVSGRSRSTDGRVSQHPGRPRP